MSGTTVYEPRKPDFPWWVIESASGVVRTGTGEIVMYGYLNKRDAQWAAARIKDGGRVMRHSSQPLPRRS